MPFFRGYHLVMPTAVAVMLSVGCDSGGEGVVELGVIEHHVVPEDEFIALPSRIGIGWPVHIVVRTVGESCVFPERMDVDQAEGSVTLVPYDRRDEATGCLSTLLGNFHETTVMFSTLGTQEIIVRGRQIEPGEVSKEIERSVFIEVE